jgi:uncharacterized protein YheU (UPF0270 family)
MSESDRQEELPPVEIPIDKISPEALDNIVREFILREGTDYGAVEISLETKLKQVHAQIKKGDVKIIFDPNTESVTLRTPYLFRKR